MYVCTLSGGTVWSKGDFASKEGQDAERAKDYTFLSPIKAKK